MITIPATKKYIKEISKLMLADLEKPNPAFPAEMISQFREHAKEQNVAKELDRPDLIAFLSVKNNRVTGFIVGYREGSSSAMIHYITGDCIKTKKQLLKEFIHDCKEKNLSYVKADTFEFMENNRLLKEEKFILTRKEKITSRLELVWYTLDLKHGGNTRP